MSEGIPTKEEIDTFYNASAPEPDILGDVDGFGLFDKMKAVMNNGKRLSQLLNEYYRLEGDNISTSIDARWRTFANDFQIGFHNLGRIEGTFNVDKLTKSEKNAWISRINNFNKLFGDGGIAAISGFQRSPLKSDYTNDMFERFTVYVREKLDNQKKL